MGVHRNEPDNVVIQGDEDDLFAFINSFATAYDPKLRPEDRQLVSRHVQLGAQCRGRRAKNTAFANSREHPTSRLQSELDTRHHHVPGLEVSLCQSTSAGHGQGEKQSRSRHKRPRAQQKRADNARQDRWIITATIDRGVMSCRPNPTEHKLLTGYKVVLPSVLASRVDTVSNALSFCKSHICRNMDHLIDDTVTPPQRSPSTDVPVVIQGFITKLFPIRTVAEQHAQWVIQNVIFSSALLPALVSVGAASLLSLRADEEIAMSQSGNPRMSSHDLITLKAIALNTLKSAIEDEHTRPEILIYSIMCMMITEMITGDGLAMRAHSEALRKAMHTKLDIKKLPAHVLETFLSCYMSSTIQGNPPVCPPIQVISNKLASSGYEIPDLLKSNLLRHRMGRKFYESDVVAYIQPDLLCLFRDLRIYTLWREYHRSQTSNPGQDEISYFHCLHWHCHYMALHPLHNYEQDAMRLGLLVFRSTSNQVIKPGSLLYHALTGQILHTLQSCDLERWSSVSDNVRFILIWLMLLGAYISLGQLEHGWFVTTLGNIIKKTTEPQHIAWSYAEEMLTGYLYMDRIHACQFRTIWLNALREQIIDAGDI